MGEESYGDRALLYDERGETDIERNVYAWVRGCYAERTDDEKKLQKCIIRVYVANRRRALKTCREWRIRKRG